MGDNKISEAAVDAARIAYHSHYRSSSDVSDVPSFRAALEAALPHLQGEAVPVAWLIYWSSFELEAPELTRNAGRVTEIMALDYPPRVEPLYLHPQPAELSEVSGDCGELDCPRADSLLREVCAQLDAVGCGACVGSMAPMEDLHGRIMQHLSYGSANEEQEIDDLTELLNQLSMRLPSKLMDRVSAALAATGKQQVGEVQDK